VLEERAYRWLGHEQPFPGNAAFQANHIWNLDEC